MIVFMLDLLDFYIAKNQAKKSMLDFLLSIFQALKFL